ncbi:MAG TPA: hypothetical protein PKG71_00945 [Candidatus Woesebacteria bacterium]|nr:hypothetical protein [Candidatus Woesebacteria bacterium]HNS94513.1 hypothetical protein [Candidatus Woesebacteria bacterium]
MPPPEQMEQLLRKNSAEIPTTAPLQLRDVINAFGKVSGEYQNTTPIRGLLQSAVSAEMRMTRDLARGDRHTWERATPILRGALDRATDAEKSQALEHLALLCDERMTPLAQGSHPKDAHRHGVHFAAEVVGMAVDVSKSLGRPSESHPLPTHITPVCNMIRPLVAHCRRQGIWDMLPHIVEKTPALYSHIEQFSFETNDAQTKKEMIDVIGRLTHELLKEAINASARLEPRDSKRMFSDLTSIQKLPRDVFQAVPFPVIDAEAVMRTDEQYEYILARAANCDNDLAHVSLDMYYAYCLRRIIRSSRDDDANARLEFYYQMLRSLLILDDAHLRPMVTQLLASYFPQAKPLSTLSQFRTHPIKTDDICIHLQNLIHPEARTRTWARGILQNLAWKP